MSLLRSASCSHFYPLIPIETDLKSCHMTSKLHKIKRLYFGGLKLCNNRITFVILVSGLLVHMWNVKTVIQASKIISSYFSLVFPWPAPLIILVIHATAVNMIYTAHILYLMSASHSSPSQSDEWIYCITLVKIMCFHC